MIVGVGCDRRVEWVRCHGNLEKSGGSPTCRLKPYQLAPGPGPVDSLSGHWSGIFVGPVESLLGHWLNLPISLLGISTHIVYEIYPSFNPVYVYRALTNPVLSFCLFSVYYTYGH